MEEIKLNATLKEAESKKGTKYVVIEIEVTPTYKIAYFPDNAEKELIKMLYEKKNK